MKKLHYKTLGVSYAVGLALALSAAAMHAQTPGSSPVQIDASPTPTPTPDPTPTPTPDPTPTPTPDPTPTPTPDPTPTPTPEPTPTPTPEPTPTPTPEPTPTPTPEPTPTPTPTPSPTPTPTPTPTPAPTPNAVQVENARPGTSNWQLTNPAINREIEGYASLTSVNRGGQIKFFVNTASPNYTIEIYRMGWYGGTGGRLVSNSVTRSGTVQAVPTPNPTTGIVDCNWINPYTLNIPTDWTSGVYLAKLTATNSSKQSYIIFVVRNDSSPAAYLYQSSVTTYQAYNNWGGKALYAFRSTDNIAAVKVSFNRPYALGANPASASALGGGEFITNFAPSYETSCAGFEYNMVRFLEREGYDVTYSTDVDTHTSGANLLQHRAFLSVGHDEYWSWEMRSNVEAARDAGVSIGFFGSNTCYWQIRFEPDANGAPNRTVVGYKERAMTDDPYATDNNSSNDYLITRLWRQNSVKPPEDAMVGLMYLTDPVNTALVIEDASNWVCANTGLRDGDSLTGLVGYEIDCMFSNAPSGTTRIGHSNFTFSDGTTVYPDLTIYTASSGAKVFGTGSMQWSWGLDDYNAPTLRPALSSPAAQQMMRNILASFNGAQPSVPTPAVTLMFSDNFDDNVRDTSKWGLGAIEATLAASNAWDQNVSVLERNHRLEITPRSSINGSHYNGYVSNSAMNFTNASASVELVQTAAGNADTYLALSVDRQNFYRIQKRGALLYFTQALGGVTSETSIPYNATLHHFWRIRHILSTDSIVCETSDDGQAWTIRNSRLRSFAVRALRLEIGAGTAQSVASPGTAIFDNLRVEVRPTTAPVPPPIGSDFNGDGKPDYVLYNSSTRQTAIWYLNNNTYLASAYGPTLSNGWSLVDVADFNGDGHPDYLLYNASTRATAIWYLNNNAFLGSAWGPTLMSPWVLVHAGDFNSDGKPDLVIYNPTTRQTAIWYLNNNLYLGGAFGPTLNSGWTIAGIADFNRDGKVDYVLFNATSRQTAIWYLNNNAFVGTTWGPTIASGYVVMGLGDFNGDLRPDYVLYKASTRQTSIRYLNNASYVSSADGPTLSSGWSLAVP